MTDPKLLEFTHLLVEQKGKYFYENEDMRRTHEVLDTINCFNNIGVEYRSVFPIKIKTRPCIIILQRKLDILPPTLGIPPPSAEPPAISNIDQSAINLPMDESTNVNEGQSDEKTDPDDDDEANADADVEAEAEAETDGTDDNDDESRESNEKTDAEETDTNNETADTEDDNNSSENTKDTENADDADDVEGDLNPDQDDTSDTANNNDEDQNIVETELKRPSKETRLKLRKLIEKHYRTRAARLPPNDQTDIAAAATVNRPSIRSNIKQLIKKEKIKELIERISQIDLRTVCDLERQTTKQCLLKVIDSFLD